MSKGSKPRPYSVSKEVFDNNWNAIFKNKNKDESHHKEYVKTINNKGLKHESEKTN